jgi:hypothetical protein
MNILNIETLTEITFAGTKQLGWLLENDADVAIAEALGISVVQATIARKNVVAAMPNKSVIEAIAQKLRM